MSKLVWDKTGERTYETGVNQVVLYVQADDGTYPEGVAWNGITAITESPSGAEATPQYADNIKYLNLISAEEFGGSIEAYTYPEEFEACDGLASMTTGITLSQQARKQFGLSYKTILGNDVKGNDFGYKLHIVYGALAAPSEKARSTINDSPEAITFSWEITTTPAEAPAPFKPTAKIVINSVDTDPAIITALTDILHGTATNPARLPSVEEIAQIIATNATPQG